jgi:hypothetical protein
MAEGIRQGDGMEAARARATEKGDAMSKQRTEVELGPVFADNSQYRLTHFASVSENAVYRPQHYLAATGNGTRLITNLCRILQSCINARRACAFPRSFRARTTTRQWTLGGICGQWRTTSATFRNRRFRTSGPFFSGLHGLVSSSGKYHLVDSLSPKDSV